ncbi:CPBP family intramembrane glutamic endopeptidase [Haloferax sulfurifontis]|uniref:Abortive infection protein n=1 Tax=Haloferax sulfurifontis ATCC BAA-897 TaxID=662480 RepID=M0HX72_9EURY|nr:CPBP family intramembrane glutamic endopeptidase [Haloferax sulfurifontis]ELZ88302.1 abortive infection protein [Haloferax sulfurifontis ATCC BAA-897]
MRSRSYAVAVADWSPRATLLGYTVLTYTISWSLWTVWAISETGSTLTGTVLFVLGGLGPFATGILLTRASDRSLRAWLRSIFETRVALRYYALALALPVALFLTAAAIHVVLFDGVVTPDVLPGIIEYPLFLGFIVLFGGGLEEPGWRGYLLPALQETYSPLRAGLIVGVVWAGWHLPLVFIPGTIHHTLPLGLYLLQLVELSILLSWLTNRVNGSVLPAILLHASGNALLNYYPVGGVAGATRPLGLGLLVTTLTVVIVALVIAAGPLLGADYSAR